MRREKIGGRNRLGSQANGACSGVPLAIRRLLPVDLHDLIGLGAAGRHHLDLGALFLAD